MNEGVHGDLDLGDLDEVRRRVVDPVLAAMLKPGELLSAELVVADDWPDTDDWAWHRWPNNPDAGRPGDEPNSLYLVLRAVGDEQHTAWLGSSGFYLHEVDEIVERLESNLNDWICESQFGWGQLRGMGDGPLPGVRADASGRPVVGLWVGDRAVEVTVDHRRVDLTELGLSTELIADLTRWQERHDAWADAAAAEERRRYEETIAKSPVGLKVTYVDAAKAAQELAAVREAREHAHLGKWRQYVAELEPARDALLTRLQTELGEAYSVPLPARIL